MFVGSAEDGTVVTRGVLLSPGEPVKNIGGSVGVGTAKPEDVSTVLADTTLLKSLTGRSATSAMGVQCGVPGRPAAIRESVEFEVTWQRWQALL